jgi:hypothetical protein
MKVIQDKDGIDKVTPCKHCFSMTKNVLTIAERISLLIVIFILHLDLFFRYFDVHPHLEWLILLISVFSSVGIFKIIHNLKNQGEKHS